jgi:hypothetical protein
MTPKIHLRQNNLVVSSSWGVILGVEVQSKQLFPLLADSSQLVYSELL